MIFDYLSMAGYLFSVVFTGRLDLYLTHPDNKLSGYFRMSLTGQNDASPTRGYVRHKEATYDYQKALAIDSEVGKWPDLRERVKFLEETLKTKQTTENG